MTPTQAVKIVEEWFEERTLQSIEIPGLTEKERVANAIRWAVASIIIELGRHND